MAEEKTEDPFTRRKCQPTLVTLVCPFLYDVFRAVHTIMLLSEALGVHMPSSMLRHVRQRLPGRPSCCSSLPKLRPLKRRKLYRPLW